MGYHETTVPEGDSASSSPDLQSSTDFFASATAIRSLIQNPGDGHSEASSDINNPVRNPDTKTANILSSQIPPDAFYVFKKALDSGEFLTENSLDSILSYCLMKENVESLSSYMDVSEDLARRIINQQNLLLSFSQSVSVLKNQRADSDKDTEGIASYYIKYPHCTDTDSLCQGSWFPQRKQ